MKKKPVFEFSELVRFKPGHTTTEDGWMQEAFITQTCQCNIMRFLQK